MRVKLQNLFGFKAFNSYGLTEMNGPGVAFECPFKTACISGKTPIWWRLSIRARSACPARRGRRVGADHPPADRYAHIRYRTRDLTRIVEGDCPCGRKHVRLSRMVGRSDDMLIVRGVNVFPGQIEEVIMRHKWLGGNYLIVLSKKQALDQMTVKVEIGQYGFDGSTETLAARRLIFSGSSGNRWVLRSMSK